MEKHLTTRSMGLSNSDSSHDSESFYSLESKINQKRNYEYQNLEQFKSISSSLTSRYNRIISKKEMAEPYSHYFNAPQKLQNEHLCQKAVELKYQKEEMQMRKNVRDLEKKLNCVLSNNEIITDEVLNLGKKKDVTEKALCIAKKYYSRAWGINIYIENPLEDRFTCIVNFKFAANLYPLKFIIDRNSHAVLDWDGSSLLKPEQERDIKERFSGAENYFPQVLSELRLIALNKINLSL